MGKGESDSQYFKDLRRGVLRAFWDLKAENGVFFRTEVFLCSVKQDLAREGRTCKILEAEVKELRGEPQASTRGLTGVQCGRGEGCNAMSQQNLEEEVGCGQTD